MKQTIIIHYHEINLKGNNRRWFENHLQQHIVLLLKGLACGSVQRFAGRLLIELKADSPVEEIARRLTMVFGVANLVVAWEVPAELASIQSALMELVSKTTFQSFKIDTRRGTKDFPLNSQQLNQQLGAFVQEFTKADVRMEKPDAVFFVEIVSSRAFLYLTKIPAPGDSLPEPEGR